MIRFLLTLLLIGTVSLTGTLPALAGTNATPRDTQIESQELELIGGEKTTTFLFSGQVRVTATNLTVTCDRLEVHTTNANQGEDSENTGFGQIGPIKSIVARGSVAIRQAGRIATADKAELYPTEGRIVLSGKPAVRDRQGEVTGEKITLLRDQRRAMVEGGESRARVRLGQLPDLGFQERSENGESTPANGEDKPDDANDQPAPQP